MSDKQQHWDKIYSDKTPLEVSWFQAEPTLSLQLIHDSIEDPGAAIIDVGGGASRLVDHLLERGYNNLAVLDISATAIAQAQQRLAERADQVEWFVEDITRFRAPRKFHLWHDRAVFHFLTDEQDCQAYVDTLRQAMESGGDVVIATFDIGGPQQCSGLDVVQYDADKITGVLGKDFELVEIRHELHQTPGEKTQPFNYFHFKKIN